MASAERPEVVKAEPTKAFFIYMLTVDIDLSEAILDLVDNSIDGARRMRKEASFEGLRIQIELDREHFKIVDNCGGISVETARKYAFRFGRDERNPKTVHGTGRFGVGMKRALFKLGRKFNVKSVTEDSRFAIDIEVGAWEASDEWEFRFTDFTEQDKDVSAAEIGTEITVTELYPSISERFMLSNFLTKLRMDIVSAQQLSLQKNLEILVNEAPLEFKPTKLLQSDQIEPAFQSHDLKGPHSSTVKVRLYAGISEPDPKEAGWYVYCNDRMVLRANQGEETGWGEGGGRQAPKYHNQFARFRGYVFFDSDDSRDLPWNTTKTGIDIDSSIYRKIRQEMINIMRPIFKFINDLATERDQGEVEGEPLKRAVTASVAVELSRITASPTFKAPKPPDGRPKIQLSHISYSKPTDEVDRVRRQMGVDTYKAVGERTFEFYLENECD